MLFRSAHGQGVGPRVSFLASVRIVTAGASDRGVLWSAGLGEAWVETSTCMAPGSILPLGSVSKLVTAAVTARLAERELIDVDADVRELVPAAASLPDKVTVRQLLGHLGGIRHYERKDFDLAQPGGIIDLRLYPDTATALALFVEDPPVAAPGAKYHYSTFAYTLLAAALEAAAGKPFLDLVADREVHRLDDAVRRSGDGVLHLHRFQHDQRRAPDHRLAVGDAHGDDLAGHGGCEPAVAAGLVGKIGRAHV